MFLFYELVFCLQAQNDPLCRHVKYLVIAHVDNSFYSLKYLTCLTEYLPLETTYHVEETSCVFNACHDTLFVISASHYAMKQIVNIKKIAIFSCIFVISDIGYLWQSSFFHLLHIFFTQFLYHFRLWVDYDSSRHISF